MGTGSERVAGSRAKQIVCDVPVPDFSQVDSEFAVTRVRGLCWPDAISCTR